MPPAITDCRLSTAGERAGERGVGGSQRRRWVAELSGPLPPTCHVDSEYRRAQRMRRRASLCNTLKLQDL